MSKSAEAVRSMNDVFEKLLPDFFIDYQHNIHGKCRGFFLWKNNCLLPAFIKHNLLPYDQVP
jgi:hypothetical protein